jgi:RNA polymerase-binding transcription factor
MGSRIRRTRSEDRIRHQRLEQLLRQQGTALQGRKQLLRNGQPSGVMDAEEFSLAAEEQGIGFSLLQLTSQTVQGIEAALRRLEAGTFGMCTECRAWIPDARLRAVPFAVLCLACQEKNDPVQGPMAREAAADENPRIVARRTASVER